MSHCKLHLFALNPSTCFSYDAACLEQDFSWLFFFSFLLPHYTVTIYIKKDILHCSQHCCSNTICYLYEEQDFPCLLCWCPSPRSHHCRSPLALCLLQPYLEDPIHQHHTLCQAAPHIFLPACLGEFFLACMKRWGGSQCVSSRLIHLFCFPFPAYRIHVSQSTVDTLRTLNEGYEIVPRGKTELKVRRPGLCEMLHKGIFSLKEFSC